MVAVVVVLLIWDQQEVYAKVHEHNWFNLSPPKGFVHQSYRQLSVFG